jgi:TPR repeat protein
VTIGVVERLNEYANGKRPVRIKALQPEFFDPRTSEPIVWYVDHGGTLELFDLMGYHPETSEELLPVTPVIADRWKAQQAPPTRVDPASHPWFDVKTGRPNIWHSPGENGELEFFDGPGFYPKTGKALTEITQDFADKLLRDKKEKADALARAEKERAEAEARARQEWADAEERIRQEQWRQQQAQYCDELAANPNDQNRRRDAAGVSYAGVSYEQLRTQTTQAIKACEVAAQHPKDFTSQYQLARAVELVDPARGQAMQDRLVKLGYPAAFDNAGSLLLHEKYCKQHCINEAVKLFQKGAARGDPDAMMSLADQISKGQAKGDMMLLYQRAAKLGHPRAKMALEALDQERTPPPIIFRFPY